MELRYKYLYEDLDRHGNVRIYVWRGKGHKKVRIREEVGTPAFRRAYDAALEAEAEPADPVVAVGRKDRKPPKPDTLRWLCERYRKECAEFLLLGDQTRHVRGLIFESIYEEPTEPGASTLYGDFPNDRLSVKAIRVLRDRKIEYPEAGNGRVKALRQVFKWAIEEEVPGVRVNYARDVPYFEGSKDGFHTWTIEEIEQFDARWPLGTKARLAKDLLQYTGARRSDAVTFGRQMIRNGKIHFTEMKGRRRVLKERELPVLPQLQESIDAMPGDHLTFLVTEFGAPFTEAGFGNWFRDRCDAAGLPQCSAHGLRKAGATIAADNGATEHQLMAIYGWESPKQAAVYTKKANRKKLAGDAMHLVVPVKSGT
ncbi:tyrosine-type recombinase/integrase [Starkeya sp. ORNL1]|uniref:tyrosine-type recombinase/integrase n=1 Tax=Starkeya sp. ORNL1 TaxID=2709380 RepID=UPI0014634BDE|nr:tyrosine-type recombinase/integrase [Starkeya sp. ORNL1]QJP14703.1 tyrosine-type recombinase/integrase [Starkeya sp. ORNL1]